MSDFISPERHVGNSGNYERITKDPQFDGFARERHEFRYKYVGQFVFADEVVVDAACGTAYGKQFIKSKYYYGIDRFFLESEKHDNFSFLKEDLETWVPDFEFDCFITIETIEHLHNYKHLLEVGRKAKRMMAISTPIEPTKHKNEFHVNDFTKEQLDAELQVDGWKILNYKEQDAQYGIWILQRT